MEEVPGFSNSTFLKKISTENYGLKFYSAILNVIKEQCILVSTAAYWAECTVVVGNFALKNRAQFFFSVLPFS